MVGFPGETDAELEQTLLFLDEIGFAKVHVFAYSRRPGTAADRMPGQIPARVKEQRSHLVIERMERARQAFFAAQLGEVFPVLFETEVSPGVFEGVTPNYTPVRAASSEPLAGTLRPVLLTGAGADWCEGVLADKTEK